MREWRKSNRLAGEARRRDLARSTANTYQARGVLVLEPCEDCGSTDRIEKHHEDYSRPLDVVFLCRTCHLARHHRVDRRAISRETASQAEAA